MASLSREGWRRAYVDGGKIVQAFLRDGLIAAGGFGRYERNHLNALAAIFVPKFAHRSLPPEMVRRVVECAFRVGDY